MVGKTVRRFKVELKAASFSIGKKHFQAGFSTVIDDDNPTFEFYRLHENYFKMTYLGATVDSAPTPTGNGAAGNKSDSFGDIKDTPLESVDNIEKKHLKLLQAAGVTTLGHVMYPEGAAADEVADLTVIKGIAEKTGDKIIDACAAHEEKHKKE
jgi:hypothetical protein